MIYICSDGDPKNPKTWSRTPLNICSEFESNGIKIKPINFKLSKFTRKPVYLLSKIYYKSDIEINRGRFLKIIRSLYVFSKLPFFKTAHVIHMSNMALPLTVKLKKQKHYVFLDSTWNLWVNFSNNKNKYSNKLIIDVEQLEFKMYNQVDHIFSISEYVKSNLINHYNIPESKISVVSTGRGVINPFFGIKDYSKKEILFVAKDRFIDKGGPLLVSAINDLVKVIPSIKLHIVGLKNSHEIKSDYLNKNIISHGFISFEKLQELFNRCTLYVMPATNEPWGLVYLEALACKMPIIGLNKQAFPELCNYGEFGYILEDDNPQSLSELINKTYKNIPELELKGSRGQEYCLRNYSWENTVNKILSIIDKNKI